MRWGSVLRDFTLRHFFVFSLQLIPQSCLQALIRLTMVYEKEMRKSHMEEVRRHVKYGYQNQKNENMQAKAHWNQARNQKRTITRRTRTYWHQGSAKANHAQSITPIHNL